MNIDKWEGPYKVRAFDWVDGESIYLNIAYYAPGASLSRPPAEEKSVLIPKAESHWLVTHLNSVVYSLMQG